MKKIKTFDIILFFLALHLFMTYSKLLFHSDADNLGLSDSFQFFSAVTEDKIEAMLSAIAYSVVTVASIKLLKAIGYYKLIIVLYAMLDGIGVLIYRGRFDMENYKVVAWYFAIYTAFMVIVVGLSKLTSGESKTEISRSDVIRQKWATGKYATQAQLAEEMGINAMAVSRALNKN